MTILRQAILFVWMFTEMNSLTQTSFPLYGNSTLGYYYIRALVGTPPQEKALILDTGSHLTIFTCSPCTHCRDHLTESFNPSRSSTFEPLFPDRSYFGWRCLSYDNPCAFVQSYSEGSKYEGFMGMDNFSFRKDASEHIQPFKMIFGCATFENGELYSQDADGIIGLGVGTKAQAPPSSLELQRIQGILSNSVFSLCLAQEGGLLSFGEGNKDKHLTKTQKTLDSSNLNWEKQFIVDLVSIKVGETKVAYDFSGLAENGNGFFLDSGSTFSYINKVSFRAFTSAITEGCRNIKDGCAGTGKYRECYKYRAQDFGSFDNFAKSFPNITYTFGNGETWEWFAQDYLVPSIDNENEMCIAVKSYHLNILGAVFMRNYNVIFDRDAKKVHFARASCASDSAPWISAGETPLPFDFPSAPIKEKPAVLLKPIMPQEKNPVLSPKNIAPEELSNPASSDYGFLSVSMIFLIASLGVVLFGLIKKRSF